LVAAAKFLVAATIFFVPNFVAVTKPFFSVMPVQTLVTERRGEEAERGTGPPFLTEYFVTKPDTACHLIRSALCRCEIGEPVLKLDMRLKMVQDD